MSDHKAAVKAAGANNVLLSQSRESFQQIKIGDCLVILSSEDVFAAGVSTDFGYDYRKDKLYIYAEEILLSQKLLLKEGIVSSYRIETTGSGTVIDAAGVNGADAEIPDMDSKAPGQPGGDGAAGGNLLFYTEDINLDEVYIAIKAAGGSGGTGQEGMQNTAGGNGGNGGSGGNVQAIIIHPLLVFQNQLVAIYKESNFDQKKKSLSNFSDSIKNIKFLSGQYASLVEALNTAKTADELNETIYNTGMQLNIMEKTWISDFQIDVSAGNYGTRGGGNPAGQNGARGSNGKKVVTPVGATAELAATMFKPFLFVHPAQCSMILEKIKLMYYAADPVNNKDGVRDLTVLLDRLKKRTALFKNLKPGSDLAAYYAANEASIGAFNSVQALQDIYTKASHLLDNLTQGLDYFGYENLHVPLASFTFYAELLTPLISNFQTIEDAYNTYYAELEDEQTAMNSIKTARDEQEAVIQQIPDTINLLKSQLLDTGRIIDTYQSILPAKKKALTDELKKIKDEISGYFDFNMDSFLSSLSMVAFAPESSLMWMTQAAQLGVESTQDITDDKGDKVNKNYLVDQIMPVDASIDGLIEGYTQEQDGTLTADDPGAAKLAALEDDIVNLLDDFYSKFPHDIDEFKRLFGDYVDTIIARNNQILTYNSIVTLLRKNHGDYDQAEQKIQTLDNDTLAAMQPDLPDLTAFVSDIYYSSRSMIMENLDLTARAFRFWALSDENLIAAAYGNKQLPDINTIALKQAQDTILNAYRDAIENFGSKANIFPYNEEDEGIVVYANSYGIESFKEASQLYINIPAARVDTQRRDNPFAGAANIRLMKVRVWIKGAKTGDNVLQVNITHTGKEKIVSTDNTLFSFHHDPRYTLFKYNTVNNKIIEDGDIGWKDTDGDKIYALVGPFASWHIQVNPLWNNNLDLTDVTEIRMEFHGTNYPFR